MTKNDDNNTRKCVFAANNSRQAHKKKFCSGYKSAVMHFFRNVTGERYKFLIPESFNNQSVPAFPKLF